MDCYPIRRNTYSIYSIYQPKADHPPIVLITMAIILLIEHQLHPKHRFTLYYLHLNAQAQLNHKRVQYVGTPRNQRSHHIFKGIISASEGDYVSFPSQNLYHNIRNFQTSHNFGATDRMKIIRFRGSVTKQAIQGEFKYSQVFPGRNSLFSIA